MGLIDLGVYPWFTIVRKYLAGTQIWLRTLEAAEFKVKWRGIECSVAFRSRSSDDST